MINVVTPEWLHENLNNVVLLDASISKSADGSMQSHDNITIPTARAFDVTNTFVDKASPYPNTLPSPAQFEQGCRQLGINANSRIVVFDSFGIFTSPRVWWLFNIMGHKNIAVLDGVANSRL